MINPIATSGGDTALDLGLVLGAVALGFRHGIDWDHIAALGDIASGQTRTRRAMACSALYALGHGLVVICFGIAAIALAERVPPSVDTAMQHVVGATLVMLGVWIAIGVVRQGARFRMRPRAWLLWSAVRWVRSRRAPAPGIVVVEHEHPHSHDGLHAHVHSGVTESTTRAHDDHGAAAALAPAVSTAHSHRHRHVGTMPDDALAAPGGRAAFVVGLLHGVGGETPTQVVIFVTAAGVRGPFAGVLLLVAFVVGLFVSNTVVAVAGRVGVLGASRRVGTRVVLSVVVAAFSVALGTAMMVGFADRLPALAGG